MLRTFSEASAIIDAIPSSPGPLSIVTFELLFSDTHGVIFYPPYEDREYSAGEPIACRGEVPVRIFFVKHGRAMLESTDEMAENFVGRLLIPSEIVGLVEMLSCRPLDYDVIASTTCTVRSITRRQLVKHLAEHPEIRSRAIRILADFVRDADRLLKKL